MPNYGKKKSVMPKSCLKHVLLHENASHQTMLEEKIRLLDLEASRNRRMLQLHRTSFIVQQSHKQKHLRAMGIHHISILPEDIMDSYVSSNRYAKSGGQAELPLLARRTRGRNNRKRGVSGLPETPDEIENIHKWNNASTPSSGLRMTQSALVKGGITRTFTTHKNAEPLRREKTYGFVGEHKPQMRLSREDPRFQSLEKSLLPLEYKMDGYLRLSPSGRHVMRQYGHFNSWLLPESRRTSVSSSYEPDPKEQVSKFMSSIGVHQDYEKDVDEDLNELDISKEYEEIMKIIQNENETESTKSSNSGNGSVTLPPVKGRQKQVRIKVTPDSGNVKKREKKSPISDKLNLSSK